MWLLGPWNKSSPKLKTTTILFWLKETGKGSARQVFLGILWAVWLHGHTNCVAKSNLHFSGTHTCFNSLLDIPNFFHFAFVSTNFVAGPAHQVVCRSWRSCCHWSAFSQTSTWLLHIPGSFRCWLSARSSFGIANQSTKAWSFQHGILRTVGLLAWQLASPRVSIQWGQGGSYIFCDLEI